MESVIALKKQNKQKYADLLGRDKCIFNVPLSAG